MNQIKQALPPSPLSDAVVERLLRTKAAVLASAHTFIMKAFIADVNNVKYRDELLEPEKNLCGTAACLAGTMVAIEDNVNLLDIPGVEKTVRLGRANCEPIIRRVSELMGLEEEDELPGIFDFNFWPPDLRSEYKQATTDQDRAVTAGHAVDRYIQNPEEFKELFSDRADFVAGDDDYAD